MLTLAAIALISPLAIGQTERPDYDERSAGGDDPGERAAELSQRIPTYSGDVAQYETRLHEARERRDRLRRQWREVRVSARAQYRNNADFERARLKVADLRQKYRTVRAKVTEKIRSDNKAYREARQKAQSVKQKIEDLREQEDVPQERIEALARELLKWEDKANSILYNAMERKDINELRRKLRRARRDLRAMDKRLRERVATDPRVEETREMLRDARSDVADARVSLA